MTKKRALGLLGVSLVIFILTGCPEVSRHDYEILREEYRLLDEKYYELESRYEYLKRETGIDDLAHFNTKYMSGHYKVGVDIPAGEYYLIVDGTDGYFCLASDANNYDTIVSDVFTTTAIITIRDNEFLELNWCYAVPFEDAPEVMPTDGYLEDGMYLIGLHIPAGEYKVYPVAEGVFGDYVLYSNSRRDHIVSEEWLMGEMYVTVYDGQYLKLYRAKIQVE